MFIEQYYIKKKVCNDLVKFFKTTSDKGPGRVWHKGDMNVNKSIKQSTETSFYPTSPHPLFVNYKIELKKCVEKYKKRWPRCDKVASYAMTESCNIQHYKPGEGYHKWHCERVGSKLPSSTRHLVFMTYLNSVKQGGETEWLHQKLKVKAEIGKTVIWPSDWTHTHRGITAKKEHKYIITGWLNFI